MRRRWTVNEIQRMRHPGSDAVFERLQSVLDRPLTFRQISRGLLDHWVAEGRSLDEAARLVLDDLLTLAHHVAAPAEFREILATLLGPPRPCCSTDAIVASIERAAAAASQAAHLLQRLGATLRAGDQRRATPPDTMRDLLGASRALGIDVDEAMRLLVDADRARVWDACERADAPRRLSAIMQHIALRSSLEPGLTDGSQAWQPIVELIDAVLPAIARIAEENRRRSDATLG